MVVPATRYPRPGTRSPKTEKADEPVKSTPAHFSSRFAAGTPEELAAAAAHLTGEAFDYLDRIKATGDDGRFPAALKGALETLTLRMRAAGMMAPDGGTVNIDARKQIAVMGALTVDELRALAAGVSDNPQLSCASEAIEGEVAP